MKLNFGNLKIFAALLIAFILSASLISEVIAQTPYTNTGKAKYVKTVKSHYTK